VATKLSEAEVQEILQIANSKRYRDLPPSKIVPLLADNNIYIASESSFYRVLKAKKQLSHRSRTKVPNPHSSRKPLIATRPNQIWSWDITYLPTQVKGVYYYLYLHIDIYSRKIMGAEVHAAESAELAGRLLRKLNIKYCITPKTLRLHADNGSSMKGATMLATMQMLGVIPSFNRPGVSNDNPFSESLFKTLKYHPAFPEGKFATIEAAQKWVDSFINWYNNEHLHSEISFVTPEMRYTGSDETILHNRKIVYENAFLSNPMRWKNKTRNWNKILEVSLIARNGSKKKTA